MGDSVGGHVAALVSDGKDASLSWRKSCGQSPLQTMLWGIREYGMAMKGTWSREQTGTKNQSLARLACMHCFHPSGSPGHPFTVTSKLHLLSTHTFQLSGKDTILYRGSDWHGTPPKIPQLFGGSQPLVLFNPRDPPIFSLLKFWTYHVHLKLRFNSHTLKITQVWCGHSDTCHTWEAEAGGLGVRGHLPSVLNTSRSAWAIWDLVSKYKKKKKKYTV